MNPKVSEHIPPDKWERLIRSLCNTEKFYFEKPEWDPKPNRADGMSCFATLKDALGVTIPGIRVAAFFYNGSRTGFAKYHYILQLYSDGRWLRALAVDVEPEWKISHRCSCTGAVHKGPHGHMGGDGTPWSEWWPIDRPYPPTPADNRRDFYEHFKLKASLVEDSTLCLEPYGVHNGVIIDLFSDDLP